MKSNPYISLLKVSWRYAQGERARYVFVYAFFILANSVIAMNPLLYGWFVNKLQQQGTDIVTNSWLYIIGFIGLILLQWTFHGPARYLERKLAFRISGNFLKESFRKSLYLPIEWHQHHNTGATVDRLRKSYQALRSFFQTGFSYINTIIQSLLSLVAILYFAPLYGTICLLIGVLIGLVIFIFDKYYVRTLQQVNEHEHHLSSRLTESLSNILTVIMLRLESLVSKAVMDKMNKMAGPFNSNTIIGEWKWFSTNLMVGLIYCIMVIGYVFDHYEPGKVFLLGGLVSLIGFVNQFTSSFYGITAQYTQVVQFYTDLKSIEQIENDYKINHRPAPKEQLQVKWNYVEIMNLNFSYSAYQDNHESFPAELASIKRQLKQRPNQFKGIRNINIILTPGSRIAMIGESGSGKTTLLSILRGLHKPDVGVSIVVDKSNIMDWDDFSDHVSLLPQEPEIFENTIEYNITLGLPFDENEIAFACETACFSDVVQNLPRGLQTIVNERGINLSGGQRQRLALARGVLASRSSSVVLLDEATNRVDSLLEQKLYANLFATLKEKTLICSIHNLNLLPLFDYVYVLRNGSVAAEGCPSEIMFKIHTA